LISGNLSGHNLRVHIETYVFLQEAVASATKITARAQSLLNPNGYWCVSCKD